MADIQYRQTPDLPGWTPVNTTSRVADPDYSPEESELLTEQRGKRDTFTPTGIVQFIDHKGGLQTVGHFNVTPSQGLARNLVLARFTASGTNQEGIPYSAVSVSLPRDKTAAEKYGTGGKDPITGRYLYDNQLFVEGRFYADEFDLQESPLG